VATNYPANSAAVQAPAPAPAVNAQPIVFTARRQRRVDGREFYQALKMFADWIFFIVKILGGTLSAKSLAVDGVGGAAAAPPAGTVKIDAQPPARRDLQRSASSTKI
jgi:hypothetical protein